MKETTVSRNVFVRRRRNAVVIYAPAWKPNIGTRKKNGTKAEPKSGDAAVVVSHDDIQALVDVLQQILIRNG